jgi:hypothetical protein
MPAMISRDVVVTRKPAFLHVRFAGGFFGRYPLMDIICSALRALHTGGSVARLL